ncbi:hypothetical protein Q0812_13160 [Brevundimonas sp. 2R-24]|uniref:DNA (Cytosine-5)-methyltransferase 1 n=1 Tax=Peiella sedimenti TaxID=3061083 RepID=A0ABT8SRQ8_9CAUL|nr:hypothetical protein [Caulobacteraceae bacterium XZ-24]
MQTAEALGPTASARDWKGANDVLHDRGTKGPPLNEFAKVWSTPAVADVQGGRKARSGERGAELLLNGQAAQVSAWATPNARDHFPAHTAEYIASKKALGHGMSILTDQVEHGFHYGRLAPTTSTDGEPTSPSGRKLNPLFVEALMGWPPGWTLPSGTASTGYECSETAWSHWWRAMRSELFSIALRPAPPAQVSLF